MVDTEDIWKRFLNKYVVVCKRTNGRDWFYRGVLKEVVDSVIVLEDEKVGEVILSYDYLSLIDSSGVKRWINHLWKQ